MSSLEHDTPWSPRSSKSLFPLTQQLTVSLEQYNNEFEYYNSSYNLPYISVYNNKIREFSKCVWERRIKLVCSVCQNMYQCVLLSWSLTRKIVSMYIYIKIHNKLVEDLVQVKRFDCTKYFSTTRLVRRLEFERLKRF